MSTPNTNQFLASVAEHEMEILLKAGDHTHISFKKKSGDPDQHFDILAYPYHLVFSGDMGSYTFSNVKDMLKFFRVEDGTLESDSWFSYGYAESNMISESVNNKVEIFDELIVQEYAKGVFDTFLESLPLHWEKLHYSDKESMDGYEDYKEQFTEEVVTFIEENTSEENEWRDSLNEFISHVVPEFTFGNDSSLWELHPYRMSAHFYWCINAIVWGIAQYDKHEAI